MQRVTRGEGVAREGPRGHTAARGRGSAARGEGLRSSAAAVLSSSGAGLAAIVPVGTTVPARQENLPVAWAGRGLRKHAVFIVCQDCYLLRRGHKVPKAQVCAHQEDLMIRRCSLGA